MMLNISKKTQVIIHDLLMGCFAWLLAWFTRFNFELSFQEWPISLYGLPIVFFIQGGVFWYFRLYRGVWRFASIPDLWNIFRAAVVGSLLITLTLFIVLRLEGVPRSILLLYPVFLIFLLGGSRLAYRFWKDHKLSIKARQQGKRALIIGGGRAGEMLIREIFREGSYMPVAILDDNKALKGAEIHGVKILGEIIKTSHVCNDLDIELIIIAIPSASRDEMKHIIEICEQINIPMRTLPSIGEMVGDANTLDKLRHVSIEDLLGREKVKLDWNNINSIISNKTVMVTGGGGSIGSALCEQIIKLNPQQLIIIEHSEFNLYKVEKELQSKNINIRFTYILGDICDKAHMRDIFTQYAPQLVLHAAAYKHVPILEAQPREALKNNILGTKVMADLSLEYKVEKFILISTDKAVNPTNILGVSKRIAETYVESIDKTEETKFITVRFGNVLDSAGSVVPLFREQIKKGGPVTVTHKDITRYFMTIDEAAQLILQAGSMGQGGEIFVLDMGEPVKIQYLAEQMIKLSGLRIDTDVQITYTGLRPGEKMYEELFYGSEQQVETSHKKIFLAKHTTNFESIHKIDMLLKDNVDNNSSDLKQKLFDFMLSLNMLSEKTDTSTNNIVDFNR